MSTPKMMAHSNNSNYAETPIISITEVAWTRVIQLRRLDCKTQTGIKNIPCPAILPYNGSLLA